ncbi:MAG: septum formation protein Maf [Bacteroidales bacterium]|nr:septum formation protein Maf [Bacteroidales bacterium]
MTLLLASKSPRRRQLLSQLGYPVKFVDVNVDEVIAPGTSIEYIAASLALMKAKGYVAPLADNEILVTADTIVVHKGDVLGKPHDRKQAETMLRSLSGDKHSVYTGVCIKSSSRQVVFTEKSDVFFRSLSDETISHYIDQGSCFDKAGAYGIQEWIGMVGVERIEGCYYNVMGLPLSRLYFELQQLIRKS